MQPAIRALRLYGGALRVPSVRGIHSTAANPNPAVIVAESRHSTETFSSHDVAQSRNITIGARASPLAQPNLRQLGPRAKANFNTSIARQDLGFMPFESNIIFPSLDPVHTKDTLMEIRVPFLPDNFHPARTPEPEIKVTKPVIATVADSATHIVAPSAIMEGLSFNFSFTKEFEAERTRLAEDAGEEVMMRAFRL